MIKNISMVFFLLLLSSCIVARIDHYNYQHWSQLPSPDQESDIEKNKAIIITKISNNILINNPIIKKEWNALGIAWVNGKVAVNKKPEQPNFWYSNNLFYSKATDKEMDVFYSESGDYVLLSIGNITFIGVDPYGFGLSHHNIFTFTSRSRHWGRLKNNETFINPQYLIDKDGQPLLASFTTNSNEIVYIGDLNLSTSSNGWFSGKIHFEVKDNYEEAVKKFRKEYPQFKNRPVVKRLIQLGSFVDKEGNAKFSK